MGYDQSCNLKRYSLMPRIPDIAAVHEKFELSLGYRDLLKQNQKYSVGHEPIFVTNG